MEQELTWWAGEHPFYDTFKTLEEVIENIKKTIEEDKDFDTSETIFIGEVEHFDYDHAANECFEMIKDRFEEIYDDWQSNLDDDKVWWEEDEESQYHLFHEIRDYLMHKTDFSVKMKAFPLYTYNIEKDELNPCH